MTKQIVWGSLVLSLCLLIHIVFIVSAIRLLPHIAARFAGAMQSVRISAVLCGGLGIIVAAHTVQIWIWATSFVALGALPDIGEAIYFALVTYTTLG